MSDIDDLVKAIDLAPHAPDQGPGARELREEIVMTRIEPGTRTRTRTRTRSVLAARRRLSWRIGAAGLVAAASALLVGQLVPLGGPSPTAVPGGAELSGTSVLLAAAAKAEAAPEGTYWRLKEQYTHRLFWTFGENGISYDLELSHVTETWVAKDGRSWDGFRQLASRPLDLEAWRRDGSPTEWAMGRDPAPPFSVSPGEGRLSRNKRWAKIYWSAMPMTLKQIEALPADPEALKKRALRAIRRDADLVTPAEEGLPETLASLLYQLPASPQVRSAAYRAMATLPGVRAEGPATDSRGRRGIAVTFPIQPERGTRSRLIIDPATSKVLSVGSIGLPRDKSGDRVVLESGWTDTRPSPPSAG
ncbi:CU044_5270 family protein [Streptosporangium sp. DT93]|uniref:CU044_5270 family protein n=1 Tax=Streptosporangium sp. DT93 TaxID=3393428 RepID=UPI003CF5336E